jgi:DNA (cytosine-5)-methyltransferase 1
MQRQTVIALGENRGTPRVYLQGKWMLQAGFKPDDRISLTTEQGKLTIALDGTGDRKVSGKENRTIPVIDIETQDLRRIFGNATRLEIRAYNQSIVVTPAYTHSLALARKLTFAEGSLFSGGGFLTEAAKQLGFAPRFGVEINPDYAEVYERNHPEAQMYNCSVEEMAWDALRSYRPLGLLTMGIPCEPFSRIRTLNKGGQEKRDKSLPYEAHDHGDLVFFGLRAIEATNPHTVLIENVPDFLKSGAYYILHGVLKRLGYYVDARVVDPVEYGELTSRKRAVIVARTDAPVVWPEGAQRDSRTLGEILEPPEGREWFDRTTKSWLYDHWDKQTAKGNGFAAQQVSADSTMVGTIKKRYFAGQGDNPVVKHPTKEGVHRWFTMTEVKRLHGIDDSYYVGDTKTLAGELIGQGVVVSTMRDIIFANVRGALT